MPSFSTSSPATNSQVFAYWATQYPKPTAPTPAGFIPTACGKIAVVGVPMTPGTAQSSAAFFGRSMGDIHSLWYTWLLNNWPTCPAFKAGKDAANAKALAEGPDFTRPATDDEIMAVWRVTNPEGAGLIFAVPAPAVSTANQARHFATTSSRLQGLWASWVAAERSGEKSTATPYSVANPGKLDDLVNEWRAALKAQAREAVDAHGGVPMPRSEADKLFAYYFIRATDIQAAWKKLITTEFNGLLSELERVLIGVRQVGDDVSKGNIIDAIGDSGSALVDVSTGAVGAAWTVIKAGYGTAEAFTSAVISGASDALALCKQLASATSPRDLVKIIGNDMGKFLSFLDDKIRGAVPTVTKDGKTYSWEDARKDPEHLIWYVAAVAQADSEKLQKTLFGRKLI